MDVRQLFLKLPHETSPQLQASHHLNQPRHIATAFRAKTFKHQIATLDGAGEVGDGHRMAAVHAPDVGQQQLLGMGRNLGPQFGRRVGKFWDGLDVH